ncbi:response regulator [Clostridioides sp. ES-S-0108-01]|uniref:response regulator n=1 Tax=Clostridioides sp. ES-S-0108-01 TaxID=2770773 RepID=UPI0039BC4615
MQGIIVEYMQKGGYTCIIADDGVEELTILNNNNIDLVILDIMMLYLDGFSVCRVSREMTSIPIIILTTKGEEEDKLKGYEYGADDYITKPFSSKYF